MENEPIETIVSGDTTIKIYYDIDPATHPRKDMDNLGTLHSFYGGHGEGDESGEKWEIQDFMEETPLIYLPVSFYEHGGIRIFTDSYTESWDSGAWGVIYVTLEDIRKAYGWKYITAKRAKEIRSYLASEVEVYSQYVDGDIYGFEVTCNQCGDHLDSNWGYYGTDWQQNELLDSASGHTCPVCSEVIKRLESITAEV